MNPGDLVKLPGTPSGSWAVYPTVDPFFQVRVGPPTHCTTLALGTIIAVHNSGYVYVVFPNTVGWIGGLVVEPV